MTSEEIAWVAGVLEGEGSFFVSWKTSTGGVRYPSFRVQCNMCDQDIILRLYRICGIGNMRGPLPTQKPHHKPAFSWIVNKRAEIKDLVERILPLMGIRRSEQINTVLRTMIDYPPQKTWGHGTRWGYEKGCRCDPCRAAHAERFRKRRQRRKAA